MTRLMTEKELQAFEATRDIEAEILQGIDDMLANNAAKRTVITETDVALARRKAQLTQDQFAKILGVSRRTLESWNQVREDQQGQQHRLSGYLMLICYL